MAIDTVDMNLIRALVERLADSVYLQQERAVIISDDMYWTIDSNEAFEIPKEVQIITGSLRDDLDELENLLKDPQRVTTPVDFERMGNVFKYLSKKFVDYKKSP
jgi:hypothetical protein